jgi:acyl-CoA reductase-like NAD-dependent aldehyde dehydrogenase
LASAPAGSAKPAQLELVLLVRHPIRPYGERLNSKLTAPSRQIQLFRWRITVILHLNQYIHKPNPVTLVSMSVEKITTISPITNKPVLTRNGLSDADIQSIPEVAARSFESFRRTTLAERQKIVKDALKLLDERQDALGKELTEQMGRPIAYTPKEVTTAVMRGKYLLKISDETLKDTDGEAEKGFKRYIRKVPLGPVLILFPWNVRVANGYNCLFVR